jgi:hypothetical protein
MKRLAGRPLAGHVPDDEEQPLRVHHEAIVEVPADGSRRLDSRIEPEARLVCKHDARIRQHPGLDPLRDVELGGRLGLRHAQQLALPLRLGQRAREHAAEYQQRPERRGRDVQQPARAKREPAGCGERAENRQQRQRRHPGAQPRHAKQQHRAGNDEKRCLEPVRAGRAQHEALLDHLLQHLRMHFDARDVLAQRRRAPLDQPQAGDADEHEAVLKLRRGLARQHVLGRDHPVGIARAEVNPE